MHHDISTKIILEIEKLISKRSYDRRVLDEICYKKTMNMKIEDALATIINSITEIAFKKISIFNLDKIS